jgi:integrase/recombinase XerD
MEGLTQELHAEQRVEPAQLVIAFVQDCRDRNLAPGTIENYSLVVKHFLEFLEHMRVHPFEVDRFTLKEYLRHRRSQNLDHKTLENNFTALSTFYGFLAFEGRVGGNPVLVVRKRFLAEYKEGTSDESSRKLISVEQMSALIHSILNPRDKAVAVLLAKTGLRRGELVSLNVQDIDWADGAITLEKKRFKKRSGRIVFFDDECAVVLRRWISIRETMQLQTDALFVGDTGQRLMRSGVYNMMVKYAERAGLHDPKSASIEDHFSTHNFRHWFTTHLRRAGMSREFIQILRGDKRRDAIDIYDHVHKEELRKAYLACVPKLGV